MFQDLVKASRSNRSFAPNRAITKDELLAICEAARYCPAAMNLQPLKYRPVTDEGEKAALLAQTRWASALSVKLPPDGHAPGAWIVICHDLELAPQKPIFKIDVGIVAQTMMLKATEMGLGGCIIGSADPEAVSQVLSLKETLVPELILGLGYPEETVVLTDAENGETKYYRDAHNVHFVPKRPLEELIIPFPGDNETIRRR